MLPNFSGGLVRKRKKGFLWVFYILMRERDVLFKICSEFYYDSIYYFL